MTQIAVHNPCPPRRRFGLTMLLDAFSLRRQRCTLARLDARALEDIGITREQADAEAARPIWDAPEFWQK
ncbi:hypothetical protein RUE5091_00369 [Ruegeria denitrificans]|uniref:YjiS-like domain-containing protein n=1 Tax=Ruegeria denitrificans TaxID=1715692 RepID=A0A0N7M8B0_9RHOB|nr:DUF1127 domain-containing protein [Ruegeria denitrificans]CUJ85652.1 hypothetical protein RUE5091_00369 [Ruegeria denitrificans]